MKAGLSAASSVPDYDLLTFLVNNRMKAEIEAMFRAAKTGDVAALDAIHSLSSIIESRDEADDGDTPLLLAAFNGHTRVVERFINANANVNASNKTQTTALILAASEGHVDIVNLLLHHHSNINARDYHQITPLLAATISGKSNVVKILLDNNADIRAKDNNGVSSILAAAYLGNFELVKILASYNANINEVDSHNNNALICAASAGSKEIVDFLLQNGSDIESKNNDGVSALRIAADKGYTEIVGLLLDKGAAIDAKSDNGWTALMSAARNKKSDVVRLLIDNGANPKARLNNSQTNVFSLAREYGNCGIVKLILDSYSRAKYIASQYEDNTENDKPLKLQEVDELNGTEFERYLFKIFETKGYSVSLTGQSGDLGVDLIAEKGEEKIAIQAKRWSSHVSRRAVSDVVAGATHYGCNKCMVITNLYYTGGAKELAKSTGCILVDRDTLAVWINEMRIEENRIEGMLHDETPLPAPKH